MSSNIKKTLPIIIIIVLAAIGVIGYSIEDNGNPIRVHFKTKGGAVIFTHQTHLQDYEEDCTTCHHNANDDIGNGIWRCRDCHAAGGAIDTACEDRAIHKQCIGANCIDCHEGMGMDPSDCGFCHR